MAGCLLAASPQRGCKCLASECRSASPPESGRSQKVKLSRVSCTLAVELQYSVNLGILLDAVHRVNVADTSTGSRLVEACVRITYPTYSNAHALSKTKDGT